MSTDGRFDDPNPASTLHDCAGSERRSGAAWSLLHLLVEALPAGLAIAAWWKLRQQLYAVHWGRGPTIFFLIAACLALLLVVPWLARLIERNRRGGSAGGTLSERARAGAWGVAVLLGTVALWALGDEIGQLRTTLARENPRLIDIGGATWAAARRFFDYGENPYTHINQLQRVSPGSGVTEGADGSIEMFGVPYYYGFAYFPAMFLAYAPFRAIDASQQAIRIGNAFWLAVLLGTVCWLAWVLAPAHRRAPAAALAALLLTTTTGLGGQLFYFGITDVVIPVFVLLAMVAASKRHFFLAGLALGLAFSAKLLPSALIVLAFFAWLARRQGLRRAAAGFIVTTSIVMVPFIVWSPAGFLSATLLFYATHHTGGDTTSLWYHLPQAMRFPFQLLGALATLAIALSPLWSRSDDLRDLLRTMTVASLIFLATSPMIHLNYQFAVVPLACVALAADAMGPVRVTERNPVQA